MRHHQVRPAETVDQAAGDKLGEGFIQDGQGIDPSPGLDRRRLVLSLGLGRHLGRVL